MPPECSKTQPLAQDCAADARVSFQVKAAAPCWARTVLWSLRYSSMSELLVSVLEEDWAVDEASLVVGEGSSLVVGAGSTLVVGAGSSLVVVDAGSSELVVRAELGACGASDVDVVIGFNRGALNPAPVPTTRAEGEGSALLLGTDCVTLVMIEDPRVDSRASDQYMQIFEGCGDVRGWRTASLPLNFADISCS